MNTLSDILAFNREHASRHIAKPDRDWWIAGLALVTLFAMLMLGAWMNARVNPAVQSPSHPLTVDHATR